MNDWLKNWLPFGLFCFVVGILAAGNNVEWYWQLAIYIICAVVLIFVGLALDSYHESKRSLFEPRFKKDQLVYFLTEEGVKNAVVIKVGSYDMDDVDIGYEYVLSNGLLRREHVLFDSFWKAKNYFIKQTTKNGN